MKGVNIIINDHWYNSFFKRYLEVYLKFFRYINRRRMNVEDSDDLLNNSGVFTKYVINGVLLIRIFNAPAD